MTRRWQPSLGTVCGAAIVGAGLLAALQPLNDNSFLTHLATGRIILDRGSVPTADPYSFTARGEPWVVQSWLVSVLYAAAERLGGLGLVRLVVGGLAGALSALGWRLLRPADGLVVRLAIATAFITVGAGQWAERPFMVGLLAFGLTILAAEGGLDPRWLVPIGWIWVNSHGSFPLGIVYLAVAALGARLDGGDWRTDLRHLRWLGLGVLLGAVGPLGPRLLLFPVELLGRQELLSNVVEWQAPTFETYSERVFLLQVVVAIVLLARRPSYRGALVTAVFVAAALVGSRNLTVASIALLPSMAAACAGLGALAASVRSRAAKPMLVAIVALGVLLVGSRLQGPDLELAAYPVDLLAYLEEVEIDTGAHPMAAPEFVGNLSTYVYRPDGRVFYDDRFDMFPREVSRAQLALSTASPSVFDDLANFDVELITVRGSHPMALVLRKDVGWRVLYTDERWLLACERNADLGGTIGRC